MRQLIFDLSSEVSMPFPLQRQRDSDRRYEAEVRVFKRTFLSRIGQTNKKMAEQVGGLIDCEEWN